MRAQARPQSHVPSCRSLGTARLRGFVAGAMLAAAAACFAGVFMGALDLLARVFAGSGKRGSVNRGDAAEVDAPLLARVSGKLSLRSSLPSCVVGVMIAAAYGDDEF